MKKIEDILKSFTKELESIKSLVQLNELKPKYLGRKGKINVLMQEIKNLSNDKKKEFGANVNKLKIEIESQLNAKKETFELEEINKKLDLEKIDITLPTRKTTEGTIHPLSKVAREIEEIFSQMGFSIVTGPEIEDDWHNFTALNTPEHHPARQMQDSFYLPDNEDGSKIVLRTQTSSVQIRHMESTKPPHKIITIGKTFRSESDSTHTPMFHQFEGLYVDKNINMGHLKSCLLEFIQKFFELDEVPPVKFRPSYFPFTEPSAEIDVRCHKGKNILKIGEGNDWMEILGCGMVHPNVIRNVGLDPEKYQGFAFGTGLERIAMLKYGIRDMRMMFDCDIRFLKHYGFKFFE
jgi:phenylalanyl-tRNA synthetase alpha chain